jgi:mannose-6-phosphate isomerase-like protein (cupin superfamily)
MGRVVDLAQLAHGTGEDLGAAAITCGETREFAAEYVRIPPRKRWAAVAPAGSDCYVFNVGGAGTLAAGAERYAFPAHAFATVGESVAFTVENESDAVLELIAVVAPLSPDGRGLAGFNGHVSVAKRASVPVVPVPQEHKQRIYFVGGAGAKSARGHAMIVIYDGQTHTPLHYHPNADSLFVLLEGAVQFTVNGEQAVVKPGQAAVFPAMDRHGLRTADGYAGASFLEFHIPAAFTTVKE